MTARAAIFDLDGTLTATNEIDSKCYVEAFEAEFGFTPCSDWSSYEHCTDEGIAVEALTRGLGTAPSVARIQGLKARFVERLRKAASSSPNAFLPIPGAIELVEHLLGAGWAVHIATGAWLPSARIKLAAAGLPVGIPVSASDGVPSRVAIVTAAIGAARAATGCTEMRAVAVGDASWDVDAAAKLALPFLGVGDGWRRDLLLAAGAGVIIPDYLDLARAVACLEAAAPPTPSTRAGELAPGDGSYPLLSV